MADFAKSIFGFGNYKKESSSQSPTPPPSASSSQQHTHSQQYYQVDHHKSQGMQQDYQQFTPEPSQQQQPGTKFFPKGLASATPTTAISSDPSVYGTTTSNTNNYSETYLNQTFRNNNSIYSSSNPNASNYLGAQFQPQPGSDQALNTVSETAPIKGKLKVTIIEAKNISATHPYVVCSFESSEFVTNPPDSYGKSPINPNQANGPKTCTIQTMVQKLYQ